MKKTEERKIFDELLNRNPYPRDIFREPTKQQYLKVQDIFKENNLIQDKFFGAYGRKVWANCCLELLRIYQEIQEDKIKEMEKEVL